jgi:transcriptional regulator with XRE-family HTH domain
VHTPSNQQPSSESTYLDPAGTQAWLVNRLESTKIDTLGRLAEVSGINKGTLSRYFRQTQRPSVDALVILCKSLQVTPSELLFGLGALPSDDQ